MDRDWSRRRISAQTARQRRLKFLSFLATVVFFLVVFFFLLTVGLFAWYAKDLPRPDKIARTSGFSTIIYDRSGEVLYDVYGDQNRVPIELSEVPESLRQATIAVEDKDFYKHQGFDLRGIGRATFNIVFHRSLQGGSTLTQQLVKNVLLTSERTLPRKIKEFILAVQIERRYSKDQILKMYLNEAPYGGTSWGVETAAQNYFGKKAKDLNLTESVVLAGLPVAPTRYSPFGENPKSYITRSEQVLRRMREEEYITKDQEEEVGRQLPNVEFSPYRQNIKAPHFVMSVKQLLVDQFGEKMVEQGGLRVTTTLDFKLQEAVQKAVTEEVEKAKGLKIGNGAAVVLDPKTGQILAMVGSKDYFGSSEPKVASSASDASFVKPFEGNFNVTLALRQPGSAIKPFTYATAFKKGYTPATLLMDVKTVFPGGVGLPDYIPEDYDGKFRGPIQARFALGNSINIAAVKTLALVGIKDTLETAYEMGLRNLEPTRENMARFGLSLTLGGGEVRLLDLTSAYGVFATGGLRWEPVSILKVTDSQGKVIFENKPSQGKRVLSEEVAFLISHILSDNIARLEVFGPRSWLVVAGKTVSVKTGTTDNKKDNWTVGYTPSFAVGTWVGNNDNSEMHERLASGVSGAAPIWNRIMVEVLKDKPDERPQIPKNVEAFTIDAFAGGLPKEGYPTRAEYFIKGTEPTSTSPVYQKLKISKANKKLANEVEIAMGEYEEKDFIVFKNDDPVSSDGVNRWQQAIEEWLKTAYAGDEKYHPPTETSDVKLDEVVVKIQSPEEHAQIDDYDVEIRAEAKARRTIVRMVLEVDDKETKSWASSSISERVNFIRGAHKIRVKAIDEAGNEGAAERRIGVFCPWDGCPGATPTPTPTLTPTPTP